MEREGWEDEGRGGGGGRGTAQSIALHNSMFVCNVVFFMTNQEKNIPLKSRNLDFIGSIYARGVLNTYTILFAFTFAHVDRAIDIRFLLVIVFLYVPSAPPLIALFRTKKHDLLNQVCLFVQTAICATKKTNFSLSLRISKRFAPPPPPKKKKKTNQNNAQR